MKKIVVLIFSIWITCMCYAQRGILVLQTDFGLQDGAVAAMKGVAMGVSPDLKIFDLTHEIPAYNIWEAAYRLEQTAIYWPKGTVFVSVVDPGVGSARKSIVMKTKSGHYFVTPDNGTLSLIASSLGIDEVRVIDEKINRLQGSNASYTFHGRDVFAYTGARLAAGKITFQQVGPVLNIPIVRIVYQPPIIHDGEIRGIIPVLDIRYGNVWTNIPDSLLKKIHVQYGDSLQVIISKNGEEKFRSTLPFVKTFAEVKEERNLAYVNSLLNVAVSINQGNFAERFGIKSGAEWMVSLRKVIAK